MPYLLFVLLVFTVIPSSYAEMYKVIDKDGHVSFTDSPPPKDKANKVETVDPVETNRMPSKTYKGELQEQFKKRTEERQEQRKEAWAAYDKRVKDAVNTLKAAERALEKGKQVGEGDRVGIVSHGKQAGSRLTNGYLERVKQLEKAVEKARENLRTAKKQRPTLMRP